MSQSLSRAQGNSAPAFLFDLDGTLVDSVYQHVLAWSDAFQALDIDLSLWRIHRRIGMGGKLLVPALMREIGRTASSEEKTKLERLHADAYAKKSGQVRPLPGARELLQRLSRLNVPWAIATSGKMESTKSAFHALGVGPSDCVITGDEVEKTKPEPDLFAAAAAKLGASMSDSIVVGDSVWDLLAARRAHALGVGLLCGGNSPEELQRAGAFRIYEDPTDLLSHLYELGAEADE